MNKTRLIAIVGLSLVVICVIYVYTGFNNHVVSFAEAQNVSLQTETPEAIEMLKKALNETPSTDKSQALLICAMSELSKRPELISEGWKTLKDHLDNQTIKNFDQFESQLDMIADYQKATLNAVLSSTSRTSFENVWKVNESIIQYRDKKMCDLLGKINIKLTNQSVLSFNNGSYLGTVDEKAEKALNELDVFLSLASDISDKSDVLIDKIKKSREDCQALAVSVYNSLNDEYLKFQTRLNSEKAKETSETGNGNFEPIFENNAWKHGGYYSLSEDIRDFQKTLQNSTVDSLLSLLYSNDNESQKNELDKPVAYINFNLELQNMQSTIAELIQIRYNIYANALIFTYRNSKDKDTRTVFLNKLIQLDPGLLFPIVNNQLTLIIEENIKPEDDKTSSFRDTITVKYLIGKKIPLEAF